jgi:hypothetical protein
MRTMRNLSKHPVSEPIFRPLTFRQRSAFVSIVQSSSVSAHTIVMSFEVCKTNEIYTHTHNDVVLNSINSVHFVRNS